MQKECFCYFIISSISLWRNHFNNKIYYVRCNILCSQRETTFMCKILLYCNMATAFEYISELWFTNILNSKEHLLRYIVVDFI